MKYRFLIPALLFLSLAACGPMPTAAPVTSAPASTAGPTAIVMGNQEIEVIQSNEIDPVEMINRAKEKIGPLADVPTEKLNYFQLGRIGDDGKPVTVAEMLQVQNPDNTNIFNLYLLAQVNGDKFEEEYSPLFVDNTDKLAKIVYIDQATGKPKTWMQAIEGKPGKMTVYLLGGGTLEVELDLIIAMQDGQSALLIDMTSMPQYFEGENGPEYRLGDQTYYLDNNTGEWKLREPVAQIDLEKYEGIEVRTALASPAELASLPDVTDLVVTPDMKPNQEFLAWLDLLSVQGQLGQPENLAEIAGHEFGPATFMKWPKPRDVQEVLDSGRGAAMFCITDAELTVGTYANPERRPIYTEAYFQIHDANGQPYLFWTQMVLGADGGMQRIPYVASFSWVKKHWTDGFDAHSRYIFMPNAFPPKAQIMPYDDKKAYTAFIEPTASETWQAARAWWDSDQITMPDWMDDYFWSPGYMITSFSQ